MAVVIGSRQGPGRALGTTQGAEVKSNPEACDPQNPQNPQNPQGAPAFRGADAMSAPGELHGDLTPGARERNLASFAAARTGLRAEAITETISAAPATARGAAGFSAGFRGRGR